MREDVPESAGTEFDQPSYRQRVPATLEMASYESRIESLGSKDHLGLRILVRFLSHLLIFDRQ